MTETIHRESICYLTETPAAVDSETMEMARKVAEKAVDSLDGAGIYGSGQNRQSARSNVLSLEWNCSSWRMEV